jgi:hypothetical protein
MEKKTLSKDEANKLRSAFWLLKEAENSFKDLVDQISREHGAKPETERWELTSDFKILRRLS